jgi:hypothetical protein
MQAVLEPACTNFTISTGWLVQCFNDSNIDVAPCIHIPQNQALQITNEQKQTTWNGENDPGLILPHSIIVIDSNKLVSYNS